MELIEKKMTDPPKSIDEINAAMIRHAQEIAREIGANKVLAYIDAIKSRNSLKNLLRESQCIMAARDESVIEHLETMHGVGDRVIGVPYMNLTRLSQVKVAAMLALSKGLIQRSLPLS